MKNNEAKIITGDEKITTTIGNSTVVVTKDCIKCNIYKDIPVLNKIGLTVIS